MTCHVQARERWLDRISLTYDAPSGTGKTTAHTDTYHGRFVKLVPNEQVVEVDEFETTDPALQGRHDASGVTTADNETGWPMALAKLAAPVETHHFPFQ